MIPNCKTGIQLRNRETRPVENPNLNLQKKCAIITGSATGIGAALFLASDGAEYITGADIKVNGGFGI